MDADTPFTPQPPRYTRTAMVLHWLMAILILATLLLGDYMHELKFSPVKLQLYSYHKWMGVTVAWLWLLRLLWRSRHAAPALPPAPRWQNALAHATHHLLYVLMLAVPLSGWLMSSAKGFQTVYLGILPIPDLLEKNAELADLLKEAHETSVALLVGLVVLHVAAALKHQWIDKDGLLLRMLPARRAR